MAGLRKLPRKALVWTVDSVAIAGAAMVFFAIWARGVIIGDVR